MTTVGGLTGHILLVHAVIGSGTAHRGVGGAGGGLAVRAPVVDVAGRHCGAGDAGLRAGDDRRGGVARAAGRRTA